MEQYRNYHEQGFEVVGVCLDSERDKAEKYIEDAELPWPSLFADDAGWKHPMATKYKITSIPTAILVDRDGNVVSLSARGEKLPELLTDLIGPVDPASRSGDWSSSRQQWKNALQAYESELEEDVNHAPARQGAAFSAFMLQDTDRYLMHAKAA
ncbi:TlpA family protein disulfide reductase [Rhodopirellula sp. ICT_H3.1]|uniref:TlpA family protein disulfide reductase n=1 Tax=Aporhodopirellula aestuarii TaxID=2950107 RepID=A0ABT0U7J1_9BACT|nr:TlpA family protein disulfide reductase [Aporhodopirellula aestuarii]